MVLSSGSKLGPYEIDSLVASGGMGEVYKARDTRLDRIVAIKVLRPHLAGSNRGARFEREARLVSQLNHPHVCTLYDIGRTGDTDYLVMEYLEGQTLAESLQRGPLAVDQTVKVAIEIASALDAAHRRGIVHRDLKPGNVMMTKNGSKLLDFGIAKVAAAETATTADTLSVEGALIGTLHYMAPEQLEGREADARSDLFAFGCVLYEMLSGTRAFTGASQSSVIAAVLEREPQPLARTQPLTPPLLERVIATCLAKNPDERWQSASDVKRQLEWIAADAVAGPSVRNQDPARPRRNTTTRTLLMVLAASATVAVSAWWAPWRRPASAPVRQTRLELSTPPTGERREASVAISPDGSAVTFVGELDGQSVLWLRPLDGVARPLEGTVGAVDPFWSPDSRSLGFFAEGKLKRIDVNGGVPQTLANALDEKGGTWSRDGTIVFAPHQLSPLVRVVPAAGGALTPVTRLLAGQNGHLYPKMLPDDAHVLYYASGSADTQGVYVSGLDGSSAKRLLTGTSPAVYVPTGYLLFVRDDVLLAQAFDLSTLELHGDTVRIAEKVAKGPFNVPSASASSHGDIVYRGGSSGRARQLTWLDRSGKTLKLVGAPDTARSRSGEPLSLSPNGSKVAVTRVVDGKSDVWLVDLARDGVMNRLTLGGSESLALWSRDGQHVLHASTRNGHFDIYSASADSDRDDPFLLLPRHQVPSALSSDGQVLLFMTADDNQNLDENTHLDLWGLRAGPGEKPFPVVRTPLEDMNPVFGPGDTWIAYQSLVSGRYDVYIRPFPTDQGVAVPISTSGGAQPRLRRDGKELFYIAPDQWMMTVPITVSSNGRSVEPGAPTRLFRTKIGEPEAGQREYDVTPDGQRFLFDCPVDQRAAPLVVIQHWRP